jgi:hypothetical protein
MERQPFMQYPMMQYPMMDYPMMQYPMMDYPMHRHRCMVDYHRLHKAYRLSKKTTRKLKKLMRECHCDGYYPYRESSSFSRWESSSMSLYDTGGTS